jgi:hypothetical protein
MFCGIHFSISIKFQFLTLEMVVLQVLRDFAGGTSIHGFTFLVRPTSSPLTKVIWAIALVTALMYASAEMRNSVISKYPYKLRTIKKKKPTIIIKYVQINLLKFESPFLSILSIYNDNDLLIMKSIPEPVPTPEPSTIFLLGWFFYCSIKQAFNDLFYLSGCKGGTHCIALDRLFKKNKDKVHACRLV